MSDLPPRRTVKVCLFGVPVFSKTTEFQEYVDELPVEDVELAFGFQAPVGAVSED